VQHFDVRFDILDFDKKRSTDSSVRNIPKWWRQRFQSNPVWPDWEKFRHFRMHCPKLVSTDKDPVMKLFWQVLLKQEQAFAYETLANSKKPAAACHRVDTWIAGRQRVGSWPVKQQRACHFATCRCTEQNCWPISFLLKRNYFSCFIKQPRLIVSGFLESL
jgi:hypothetical protein